MVVSIELFQGSLAREVNCHLPLGVWEKSQNRKVTSKTSFIKVLYFFGIISRDLFFPG